LVLSGVLYLVIVYSLTTTNANIKVIFFIFNLRGCGWSSCRIRYPCMHAATDPNIIPQITSENDVGGISSAREWGVSCGSASGVCMWISVDSPEYQSSNMIRKWSGFHNYNLLGIGFFFVYSYSHATYIDHGGVHFTRFSRPQSARGGSLQAPLVPSARPSRQVVAHQGNRQRKDKRKPPARPLLLLRRCHEGWGG